MKLTPTIRNDEMKTKDRFMDQPCTPTQHSSSTTINILGLLIGWFTLAYLPLTGPLQAVYRINLSAINQSINAFPAGLVVGYLLFGYASDHWKTQTSLRIPLGLWLTGSLLLAFPTPTSLLIARFLWGIGCGSTILAISYVSRRTDLEQRAQSMAGPFAWMLIGNSTGILVMTSVFAWSSSAMIWTIPFLGILLLGGRALWKMPHDDDLQTTSMLSTLHTIRLAFHANKTLLILCATSFFSAGAAGTFTLGLVDVITSKEQFTETHMWTAFALIYLLSVGGASLVLSRRRHNLSDKHGLLLSLIAAGVAMLLPLLADHALLPSLLATTIPLFFIDAFWSSLFTNATPEAIRGSLTALGLCVASAGRFLLPTLVGYLTPSHLFLAAAASASIAVILVATVPLRQKT